MATIERFEDLDAWKLARELTRGIYGITKNDPFVRDFGLRNQICRASVSTMSNIAEGFERDGRKEFISFLSMAKGSAGEVRSQLYPALDQNYLTPEEFRSAYDKAERLGRAVSGLISYLSQSDFNGHKFKTKTTKHTT
jgi:four helix bundle protein